MRSHEISRAMQKLEELHAKRMELLDEYQRRIQLDEILAKHGRAFILIDDERGTKSLLGIQRMYYLLDHNFNLVAAGSQSQVRTYIRTRKAEDCLADHTHKYDDKYRNFHVKPLTKPKKQNPFKP